MKPFVRLSLSIAFACFTFLPHAEAQISGLTRRVVMSPAPGMQNLFYPSNAAPARVPAPVTAFRPAVPANPVRSSAEQGELFQRTIAFQKQQAESGSPSFQYALGLRHLTGDGVEKNLETARHWLSLAAKQGNQQATKKLAELSEPAASSP